ncbi:MAG: hypothetical protein LBC02_10395 [Planctomycetaceae bacterium]|jgi:hypothetical protein|nr:hypothetical protein [Planctomycetaceae bacterium]
MRFLTYLLVLIVCILFDTWTLKAQETSVPLHVCMTQAWNISWERFYLPQTSLFYDYLTSYEPGSELKHLPKAEEVARQFPNVYGYGTGMEDCMISAGVILDMIVDQYAVTKDESLREKAKNVFQGIKNCTTVHGVPGFLARGICPEDKKSIYINSSRDQYTHAIHGLWIYFHSPLCDNKTKKEISTIVSAIAERMIRNVVAENDYDSLRADGTRDTLGISRMWNIMGHESARLPMIYAIAWNITGQQKYFDLYQHYLDPALEQSLNLDFRQPTYALLQMQDSMQVLKSLEKEPKRITKINKIMTLLATRAAERAKTATEQGKQLDLTMFCSDWRTTEGLSVKGHYRRVWYCIRESGEAALIQLMNEELPFSQEQKNLLAISIRRLNYERVSSCGIFYLLGSYWKARKYKILEDQE